MFFIKMKKKYHLRRLFSHREITIYESVTENQVKAKFQFENKVTLAVPSTQQRLIAREPLPLSFFFPLLATPSFFSLGVLDDFSASTKAWSHKHPLTRVS